MFTEVEVQMADGSVANATVPLVCTGGNENPTGFVSFDNLNQALWTVFMMSSMEVRFELWWAVLS